MALQTAPSGVSHSYLATVTSLTSEEVEQSVQRLEALDRAYHIVQGQRSYCIARSLPAEPVFQDWQEWLADFCEAQPQFEYRDRLATTYACCGVVLLTALVGGTTDPEMISRVTTLPFDFVSYVLALADSNDIWKRDSVFHLNQRLRGEKVEFAKIENYLHCVKETFWDSCWTPAVQAKLQKFRGHRQYGGNIDYWTDAEDVDGVDGYLE